MKNKCLKQGFTLIELLVVVLIVGILAAVALPQYQLAVLKSRFVKAKTAARQIADAEEIYYMANGKYTIDMDELDIDMPNLQKGWGSTNEQYYTENQFQCNLVAIGGRAEVQCGIPNTIIYRLGYQYSTYDPFAACIAYGKNDKPTANDLTYKVCVNETQNPSSRVSFGATTYSWTYKGY